MTVKELAQRLKLDSPTLTPILKRLESNGLVTRQRRQEDERIVNIYLTAEGRNLEHRVAEMQHQVACQTGLGPTEFFELRDNLHRLIETMHQNQPVDKAVA